MLTIEVWNLLCAIGWFTSTPPFERRYKAAHAYLTWLASTTPPPTFFVEFSDCRQKYGIDLNATWCHECQVCAAMQNEMRRRDAEGIGDLTYDDYRRYRCIRAARRDADLKRALWHNGARANLATSAVPRD